MIELFPFNLHRTATFRQSGYSLPSYLTQVPVNVIGRPLQDNEIFDVLDSRHLEVPLENKFNVPLDEIEVVTLLGSIDWT